MKNSEILNLLKEMTEDAYLGEIYAKTIINAYQGKDIS